MKPEEQDILRMLKDLKTSVETEYGVYDSVSLTEFLADLENNRINTRLKRHPFRGEELDFTEYRKRVMRYREISDPASAQFGGFRKIETLLEAA
jgi:hypothetical protein